MGKNQNNPGIQLEATEENGRENLSRRRTFGELSRVAWRRRKAQKAQNVNGSAFAELWRDRRRINANELLLIRIVIYPPFHSLL
jgi:hypothetical protein